MTTPGFVALCLAVAVPFWLLDALWLGVVAKTFYRRALGPLMARKVQILPAALFYLAYPIGLALFALAPNWTTHGPAQLAGLGALFGLFCYGTYDLVNQATLDGWPWRLTLVDMAWGTFASAAACAVARAVMG